MGEQPAGETAWSNARSDDNSAKIQIAIFKLAVEMAVP